MVRMGNVPLADGDSDGQVARPGAHQGDEVRLLVRESAVKRIMNQGTSMRTITNHIRQFSSKRHTGFFSSYQVSKGIGSNVKVISVGPPC